MSEQESLLRGYLAAGDSGGPEALGHYLHDDVVVHDPGGLTAVGLDHEKETWRKARQTMPGLSHKVQEVVSEGSTLAARVVISGTLRGSFGGVSADGKGFKVDQAIFMHIQEGKAKEMWAIVDTGSFRQQVGADQ
jgi:predicted ester cyclase